MCGELCGDLHSSAAQPWVACNSRGLSLCGNCEVSSTHTSKVSVAAAAAAAAATELLASGTANLSAVNVLFCSLS